MFNVMVILRVLNLQFVCMCFTAHFMFLQPRQLQTSGVLAFVNQISHLNQSWPEVSLIDGSQNTGHRTLGDVWVAET
jgi:hypothetical protein